MGQLTHAQLVTEAVELAGNTGLTTRAQTWLGLVLRHLAERFTFSQGPNTKAVFVTTPGLADYEVGSEVGGSADVFSGIPIRGIKRMLCGGDSADGDWAEMRVETVGDVSSGTVTASAGSGFPFAAILEPRDPVGGFDVTLVPTPDKAYRIMVLVDAAGLTQPTYSAAAVSEYPNDMTIVQGVYALCLKHQQDEREASAWSLFEKMAGDDRVRYGNMNTGQKLRLNPKTFRPSGGGGKPWDWMGPK